MIFCISKMLKKQGKSPQYEKLWILVIQFLFMLFFLYLLFPLRRCDYHFLLQWGLGHAKTWMSTFSVRTYFETHLVLLRFTCCLFLEIKFWTFWHFPLEVRFLNNWGLKKSYNITVFNPSKTAFARKHTIDVSKNLGEVLFLIMGTGEYRLWGEMRGTFLCTQDELTVMKYGMLGCLIILSLVLSSHRTRKKYTQNDIYARNFKTSSMYLIDWWLFYGFGGLADVKGFGIWFWNV